MVDGCAENAHLGGEAHISIDQRRHIDAELANLLVQDFIIVLEVIIFEKFPHLFQVCACFQRTDRSDQPLRIGEVHVQEIQDHVAGFGVVGVVHRHFSEIILQAGVNHGKSSQSVPKVIQHKQPLGAAAAGRLVFQCNERTAKFDRVWQIFFVELIGEIKQMGRC